MPEGPHLAQLLPAAPKFRLRRIPYPFGPPTWAFAPLSPTAVWPRASMLGLPGRVPQSAYASWLY